jgi:hypothetical protein
MAAKVSGSEPRPSPATVNDVCRASCQFFTGEVCQVEHSEISLAPLPIQVNLVASYFTRAVPIRGSTASPRPKVLITVPSLAATL